MALQRFFKVLLVGVGLLLAAAAVPLFLAWRAPALPAAANAGAGADRLASVVVDLKDDATAEDVARLDRESGLDLAENSPEAHAARLMRAEIAPGEMEKALAALRADPIVEAAEQEVRFHEYWTPNDVRYKEQWNFRQIGMEKAWDVTRGKGAVVAVIDTGVAFENDSDGCYQAKDFGKTGFVPGFDFIHDNKHPNDDQGHGTHVAGTIAESTHNKEGCAGIAPEAKIMPIKVLSKEGYGSTGDIADGIRWAADHGANVINMSLGSPFPSAILHAACQYAYKKGVTIVCAAGNSGTEGVGYPAAFRECIAVSAVGPGGKLAPYSSYGPQIAVAAPGGDKSLGDAAGVLQNTVLNGQDDYYSFQGTSMASPHVAGVAALLISQGIRDPGEVKAAIQKAARPKAPRNQYGAGLLDAGAAVARTTTALGWERPVWSLLSWLALGLCVALGVTRRRLAGTAGYPVGAALALGIGLMGPDWLTRHFGWDAQINMLGHSLLLPALLLTEVESRAALRWVAMLAGALTMHLLWDLRWNSAPFPALADWQTTLWLGANCVAGLVVGLIALFRAQRASA
jgi:serine protease